MSEAQGDIQAIKELSNKAFSAVQFSENERNKMLQTFEKYECWEPFFFLLQKTIADQKSRCLDDYVRKARVEVLYLEDLESGAETCAKMIADLKLSFPQFFHTALPQIIEFEDWKAESLILKAASKQFAEKADHIACLERLAVLFEKKIHSENELARAYQELLNIDPKNVKALRYFKMVFSQTGEWEEVVSILRSLLQILTHPQEIFRVGQEMSTIFLYQMDDPSEALKVLRDYCSESPLDTSNIRYDAYQRLGDKDGSLRVLRECLLNVSNDQHRAILHYKIGMITKELGDVDESLENFRKSSELSSELIDPLEEIISIYLKRQDWQSVRKWLGELTKRLQDESHIEKIKEADMRLKEGLERKS